MFDNPGVTQRALELLAASTEAAREGCDAGNLVRHRGVYRNFTRNPDHEVHCRHIRSKISVLKNTPQLQLGKGGEPRRGLRSKWRHRRCYVWALDPDNCSCDVFETL